ncbi:MAG: AAA family ATPase [Lentimicrobium sp.]|nr:AAA family ATPase [Lentimicrobium sp.]
MSAAQWATQYLNAILDEVQKEPVLIESIKSVYDQFDSTKYILLGSSQFLLLKQVKESLAGRCTIYDVMPLTLPEIMTDEWETQVPLFLFRKLTLGEPLPELLSSFLLSPKHAKAIQAFNHYLNFGGYPAVVDTSLSDDDRREWLSNYIRTYLERDIRDLVDFRDLKPFVKTQKATALLTGTLVNFSQLAREADIAANTAHRFLNYLELSYQVILLKPWARNNLKLIRNDFA